MVKAIKNAGNLIMLKTSAYTTGELPFFFPKQKQKARKPQSNLNNQLLITTDTLMNVLDCGRHTALEIGKQAGAKVCIGRKLFWNVKRIQQYIDDIAE